jgi:hypothetical protein
MMRVKIRLTTPKSDARALETLRTDVAEMYRNSMDNAAKPGTEADYYRAQGAADALETVLDRIGELAR